MPSSAASEGTPPASSVVRAEWLRRVEAEYHSCAVAGQLALWLIQIGASPDLIEAALAIAADELRHAAESHRVFQAAGGEGAPRLVRDHLQLARDPDRPLEHDVLRAGVELFCLGETVAVPLFKELRRRATVPVARGLLDQVLRDEVRHRDFGWTLLAWQLATPLAAELRPLLDAELPAMLGRLCQSYAPAGYETLPEPDESECRWGLMPAVVYAAVLRRTWERDYRPRFARLGVTCPPLPLP